MTDVVYFIAAPDIGQIKIGRAKDALARLKSLETASPVKLELLGIIPDGTQERSIHKRFAECRQRGEWFAASPDLEAFIAENVRPYVPGPPAPLKPPPAEATDAQATLVEIHGNKVPVAIEAPAGYRVWAASQRAPRRSTR